MTDQSPISNGSYGFISNLPEHLLSNLFGEMLPEERKLLLWIVQAGDVSVFDEVPVLTVPVTHEVLEWLALVGSQTDEMEIALEDEEQRATDDERDDEDTENNCDDEPEEDCCEALDDIGTTGWRAAEVQAALSDGGAGDPEDAEVGVDSPIFPSTARTWEERHWLTTVSRNAGAEHDEDADVDMSGSL